jgi:hypothetical protein
MCSAPVAIAGHANSGQRPLARIEARFSRTANLPLTTAGRLTARASPSALRELGFDLIHRNRARVEVALLLVALQLAEKDELRLAFDTFRDRGEVEG